MSLKRIFSVIGAVMCVIVILTTTANYLVGWNQYSRTEQKLVELSARTYARSLQWYVSGLIKAIENIARQPRLAMLLDSGNTVQLAVEEETLGGVVPGLLKIRVLKVGVSEPDQSVKPHMSFADLEMIKLSVGAAPQPAVHAFKSDNRHIAIARRIMLDDQAVGVVLASVSTEAFSKMLNSGLEGGAIELVQGPLSLTVAGNVELKSGEAAGSVAVPGTPWQVKYWVEDGWHSAFIYTLAIILASCLLVVGALVPGYRWFRTWIAADQEIVVSVARGLVSGKVQGSYPVKLKESESLISKMIQLKRESRQPVRTTPAEISEEDRALEKELAVPATSFLSAETDLGVSTEPPASGIPASIFRAYDIRGVVGEALTADTVGLIANGLGTLISETGQPRVAVARDGRLSSPELGESLIKGLVSAGCNVVDLGMVPTPLLYFATHFLDTGHGVVLTGSHNPPEYNGLKMVVNGETLCGDQILQLRARIEQGDFASGEGSRESMDLLPDYVGTIADDIQVGCPMKVVVDCGNGVAGKLAPVLLRTLGCEVVELYCEVDGNFPNHHPDPGNPANMQDLIARVKKEGANLGLAFDGDGDRLGVVDSSGSIIWPDRQMMLFSEDVLSRQPGADIIFDVKCSRNLSKTIVNLGGRPLMWKSGHSLMKAKMRETGAALAGELSGHIFFGERWFGFDDGLYAAARLIEILSADPRPSNEIFADVPDSASTPEIVVPMDDVEKFGFIEKFVASGPFPEAKITDIDGLRADFLTGWGLIRASNTLPALIARFEADNDDELRAIQAKFSAALKNVRADLEVPF